VDVLISGPDQITNVRVGFARLKEGDQELVHGKKIEHLICKHRDYIVYLDSDLYVFWAIDDDFKKDWKNYSQFGEVVNEVSYLEAIDVTSLPTHQVASYRRMLGEAVARLLDTQNPDQAKAVLEKARSYINARSSENARLWYLTASLQATAGAVIVVLLIWAAKAYLPLGFRTLSIILGVGAGALGAFLSILLRSHTVPLDISASKRLYRFEGFAKVLAGMIGALLVALGVEAKFLFGNINSSEGQLELILVLCIVAGASERLIPSIIRNVELAASPPSSSTSKEP
jgi:hypothetical protein